MIYDRAMRQGLVSESAGKTPEATMAAALYTDIKKYRNQSTFIKPREGLFGLRDWTSDDCTILVGIRDKATSGRPAEAKLLLNPPRFASLWVPKGRCLWSIYFV